MMCTARRPHPKTRTARRSDRAGFTLLETALALIIIGVGVLAIIEAQQAFLIKNAWSTNSSTATYLASEIREMTRSFARHDRFSGGIYFADPDDVATFTGWGPETGETTAGDFDDFDDLDGLVLGDATDFPAGFTMTQRLPGPINAFGEVLTETLWDGTTELVEVDGEVQPVSMRGWTQIIEVEKVDPFDYSLVLADDAFDGPITDPDRPVDQYPLRVRVTVLFESEFGGSALPITTVTWVVPP